MGVAGSFVEVMKTNENVLTTEKFLRNCYPKGEVIGTKYSCKVGNNKTRNRKKYKLKYVFSKKLTKYYGQPVLGLP